mmetsp:Transcript_13933/g.32413  ORF Transcript_13933/g.32413 Transcript_13933/m.32413 type:complete len:99 (+) Transcript_13933:206-502(+)
MVLFTLKRAPARPISETEVNIVFGILYLLAVCVAILLYFWTSFYLSTLSLEPAVSTLQPPSAHRPNRGISSDALKFGSHSSSLGVLVLAPGCSDRAVS